MDLRPRLEKPRFQTFSRLNNHNVRPFFFRDQRVKRDLFQERLSASQSCSTMICGKCGKPGELRAVRSRRSW
jgi:hypothetical protein